MNRMRVMVVDDEPFNLEVAKVILEAEGHVVETAHDGLAALSLCHDEGTRFDLVLMDLAMPVMDGVEAIRQLRASPDTQELPILVVTGSSDHQELLAVREAGGNAIVHKPFRRIQLLHAIDALLVAPTSPDVIR